MLIEIDGVSRSPYAWSIERGLGRNGVQNRLEAGWHPQVAVLGRAGEPKDAAHKRLKLKPVGFCRKLSVPPTISIDGVAKPVTAWSRERGLGTSTVRDRIRHGWHERAAVLGERGEHKQEAHDRLGLTPTTPCAPRKAAPKAEPAPRPAKHPVRWTTLPSTSPPKPERSAKPCTERPLDKIMAHRLLGRQREVEIFTEYAAAREKHGAQSKEAIAIRNRVVEMNMRLVALYARRYGPVEDHSSDGVEGLIIAVERFDVSRGLRFSTYASWWVRHYLQRSAENTKYTVRVPVWVQTELRAGRAEPNGVELVCGHPTSFDAPMSSKDGRGKSTLHDVVACEQQQDAPDGVADARRSEALRKALATLSEREREIIERRFGLRNDDDGETLQQIGEGSAERVCRERVRQLQNVAMIRLRSALGGNKEAWL
jgi:RNA polymerase nonessential primary-like sigma factor